MKKVFAILPFVLIYFCFSFKTFSPKSTYYNGGLSKTFSPQSTWYYNGGSGPQIPVTYNGSSLIIGTLPYAYNNPLRVRWYTPSGTVNQAVWGSFVPYGNYNFTISGSCYQGGIYYSSDSYYNYQP